MAGGPDEQGGTALTIRAGMLLERARRRAAAAGFRRQGRESLAHAQTKRCAELLISALDCEPACLSARFLLASCMLQLGEFELAREQAQASLRICSELDGKLQDPILHLAGAYASLGLGEDAVALGYLRDASASFPEAPQASLVLARLLDAAGHAEESALALQQALASDSASSCRQPLTATQRQRAELRLQEAGGALQAPLPPSAPTPSEGSEVAPSPPPTSPMPMSLGARASSAMSASAFRFASGCAAKAASPAAGSSVVGSPRIRTSPFGPREPGYPADESTAMREAALQDLEALFSNLLPSANNGLRDAMVSVDGVAFADDSRCCSCRLRTVAPL